MVKQTNKRYTNEFKRKAVRLMKINETGFTLIELMIVVAIIGLLASAAIPAFVKYIRKAKTTEAIYSLQKMADGFKSYITTQQTNNSVPVTPAEDGSMTIYGNITEYRPNLNHKAWACKNYGGKFPADRPSVIADFNRPSWKAIMFKPSDYFYYRYKFYRRYYATTKNVIAYFYALGDLDCDGTYSEWKFNLYYTKDGWRRQGPYIRNGYETE